MTVVGERLVAGGNGRNPSGQKVLICSDQLGVRVTPEGLQGTYMDWLLR